MAKKTARSSKIDKNGGSRSSDSTTKGKKIIKSKVDEPPNADDSSEEELQVSSSAESLNGDVSVFGEGDEEDGNEISISGDDEEVAEEDEPRPKIAKNKKGKKRVEEDDEDEDTEKKRLNVLYRFPMNRVKTIIKEEIPDLRISPEAVFLINRASEKFLKLLSKEAYVCAFLDQKNYTSYHHLSSIVCKRKRFSFLSDFVPEMVKAEDALAQISDTEK